VPPGATGLGGFAVSRFVIVIPCPFPFPLRPTALPDIKKPSPPGEGPFGCRLVSR